MSIRATATGSLIERYSGLCPYDLITASGWIYPTSFATELPVFIQQSAAGAASDHLKVTTGGVLRLHTAAFGTSAVGTTVLGLNQWHHVTFKRVGNTRTAYLNGISEVTLSTVQTWTKVGEGWLGLYGQVSGAYSLGGLKMWAADLSAGDIQAELYGYDAVKTSDLHTVSRLLTGASIGNEVSGGVGWTLVNTVAEGEPLAFPSAPGGGSSSLLKSLLLRTA